jgi:pimeloyl-ACP methyl ester carboxylesterase
LLFNEKNLEKGMRALEDMHMNLKSNQWWYSKGSSFYDEIKWIPQSVPTMLVSGEDDLVTPGTIFQGDLRFNRKNIEMRSLKDVGHFSLIDAPLLTANTIDEFIKSDKRV